MLTRDTSRRVGQRKVTVPAFAGLLGLELFLPGPLVSVPALSNAGVHSAQHWLVHSLPAVHYISGPVFHRGSPEGCLEGSLAGLPGLLYVTWIAEAPNYWKRRVQQPSAAKEREGHAACGTHCHWVLATHRVLSSPQSLPRHG